MIWFLVYNEIVYIILERKLIVNTSSCINENLCIYGQIANSSIKYWIVRHTTHYVPQYLRMWRFCLSSIVIVDIVQEHTG